MTNLDLSDLTVAVILPAYNEELTIEETIRDFHKQLPDAYFLVVNNNSTDETEIIAQKTIDDIKARGRVIGECRQGKGNAVRRAFYEVDADYYVMADADMTYPAERVHDLLKPVIDGKADMVVGDRHTGGHYSQENKRNFHDFGNYIVKKLVNKLFNANLKDIMTGYRVFNKNFVKSYPILVEGFEIETDMTMHALDKRFRIIEIPIEYKDRPNGSESKLNTFRDGMRVILIIVRILRHYKPLLFFGGMAMFFALIGALASVPVFDDWFREKFIHHVPLAILASGLEIVAVLMLAIGLILDSIAQQDKRNFERSLLKK